MSRLPELPPESMNEAQRAALEEIVSGPHGRVAGPFHAWLHSPELARRARSLSEFIRFGSSLPDRLRELAILVTGRYWKAEFEFHAHSIIAGKAGLDKAIIAALAERRRPEFKQREEEAVYDFCTEMFETHGVSDEVYGRAVEILGETTVVELIATMGYYSMVSMTLNAFRFPLPQGVASPFPD